MKPLLQPYADLRQTPFVEIEHLLDETYLFHIYVRREHSEFIAQHLFLYFISFDDN